MDHFLEVEYERFIQHFGCNLDEVERFFDDQDILFESTRMDALGFAVSFHGENSWQDALRGGLLDLGIDVL